MIFSIFKYFKSDFTDPPMSNVELASFIDDFLCGAKKQGKYEWDDFTIFKSKNENVEKVRQRVVEIGRNYPDKSYKTWCTLEGEQVLRELAEELRGGKFNKKN